MSNHPLTIERGVTVGIRGTARRCIITQVISASRVAVRDVDSQEPPEEMAVEMLIHPPPAEHPDGSGAKAPAARLNQGKDLGAIETEAWAVAVHRLEIIKPFVGVFRPPSELVEARAKEYGYHYSTLYRWLRIYRNSGGLLTALLDNPPSTPKGTKKLEPKVEKLLNEVIVREYLTPQRLRVRKIVEILKIEFESHGFPLELIPHINTIRRRVAQLSGRQCARSRFGSSKATKYESRGSGFQASYPLEYVQIDHTQLNVTLVDEKGRNMGRPYLTVAIDVFSRMIVGYYIAFEAPGALATGMCISQSILSKEGWLREHSSYFTQMPEWPCFGTPVHLHADNGKDFRGDMVKRACAQYRINAIFRPVRQPQYGAHIESLMDKISVEVSSLPGTTFSNPTERGKHYDSEAKATMTMDDLNRWAANFFLCVYHYRVHSALGKTPLERWNQGFVEGSELAPALGKLPNRYIGEAAERLALDFLPFEERMISEAGVVIEKVRYVHPVLRKWIHEKDADNPKSKRKFIFRYDPRDMSYLFFWNPELERYDKIPYRNLSNPPVTIWELRTAQDYLTDQRGCPKDLQNEAMIFGAIKTIRAVQEESFARTGKMKAAGKLRPGVHRGRVKKKETSTGHSQTTPAFEPEEGTGPLESYDDLEIG